MYTQEKKKKKTRQKSRARGRRAFFVLNLFNGRRRPASFSPSLLAKHAFASLSLSPDAHRATPSPAQTLCCTARREETRFWIRDSTGFSTVYRTSLKSEIDVFYCHVLQRNLDHEKGPSGQGALLVSPVFSRPGADSRNLGGLFQVWLAAHVEKKLSKNQLLYTSIPKSVEFIISQDMMPMALRLSGQLLLGVTRIYSRQAKYLMDDCNEALLKIKMPFRPGAVDMPEEHEAVARNAITLQENRTEFDMLYGDAYANLSVVFSSFLLPS
jgi:hypothetical protein